MKLLKTISKNILAFLLLLIAILWIAIPFLFLILKAYFRELNNFIYRKETHFPEMKQFYYEIKKLIKEYFRMKFWQQAVSCALLMFMTTINKWTFTKKNDIAVGGVTPINIKTNGV